MSESAWEAATRTWVEEGWVDEAHREAVQGWLDANRPVQQAVPSPFLDVALVAVVTVGNWLLVGALVLATGLLTSSMRVPEVVALLAGTVQLAAAIGARVIGARALAQGFFSAWVVVVVLATMSLLNAPWEGIEQVNLLLVLVPCAVAWAIAFWDEMPGLAAAGAMAAVVPLMVQLTQQHRPAQELMFLAVVFGTAVAIAAARIWPRRGMALAATVPFATLLALWALVMHKAWLSPQVIPEPGSWETGGVSAVFGLALIAGSVIAGSRLVLVSGVAAVVFSEVVVLVAIGDFWIAIGVLGIEGVVLIGGAVAALVIRSLGAQRAARG